METDSAEIDEEPDCFSNNHPSSVEPANDIDIRITSQQEFNDAPRKFLIVGMRSRMGGRFEWFKQSSICRSMVISRSSAVLAPLAIIALSKA